MKRLIYKFLSEINNEEEKQELEHWLTNPKNKAVFKSYVRDSYLISSLYNDVNTSHAYKKVSDAIIKQEESVKTIPLHKRSFFKYAAAIVIFISASYFFLTKDEIVEHNTPIIVNNNIKTGTDKATLTNDNGSVIVLEKGQVFESDYVNSNGEKLIYKKNSSAKQEIVYNYLTIPRGGQYFVELSDGTQIWLNSETRLKYPVNFIEGETREVELVYGEAYFDVSPNTNHNGDTFKVLSGIQDVEVLGTKFNIKAYKDEDAIYTTLVEGKVNVNNTVLIPNHQSILNKNTKQITVNLIDVYNETSWKEGVFSFKNKPLKEITKVLSRWYDVDFVFINKDLEYIKFNGVLGKNQNIENILLSIKTLNNIEYAISDKLIQLK